MLVTPASRVLLSADFQRDKQFTIEQPIAEDCYMAAEMEGEAALGWYWRNRPETHLVVADQTK